MEKPHSPGNLFNTLRYGQISRRHFVEWSALLGLGSTTSVLRASTTKADTRDAPSGVSPELRIIEWPTLTPLNPSIATGVSAYLDGCFVLEPLMRYLPVASVAPNLVTQVPSVENGQLAEDSTSVTLTLLPGVLWSDGTPFTAADVAFTWEWTVNEANKSSNIGKFQTISGIEVVDELTAQVSFTSANPHWFAPFTGAGAGFVLPKHVLSANGGGQEVNESFATNPIGTGPYIVESFTPNDRIIYAINRNYREPNLPYFSRIILEVGIVR